MLSSVRGCGRLVEEGTMSQTEKNRSAFVIPVASLALLVLLIVANMNC
jgi:hypothetical protein